MTTATRVRSLGARLIGANNEGMLALIIMALVIVMSLLSPSFFTVHTLFAIVRSALVPTVLAIAVLLVIISGGIDVSFVAIAIFAAYTTVKLARQGQFDPGIIGILIFACVMGACLGAVNGVVIARFRLPTLIVSLATQGIFRGILLVYVGSRYIAELPNSMASLSTANLIALKDTHSYLPLLVVPVAILVFLAVWMLRRTMFGRGLYAIGGDTEAARRAGFPVVRFQLILYVLVGVISAAGGLIHVILNRNANPQDIVGTELDVIAAVVLGGASVFGGRGSVLGTVLGVVLVQLINNSLILIGVPTAWQRTAVGLLLVIGVGVQAISARRASRRTFTVDTVEA